MDDGGIMTVLKIAFNPSASRVENPEQLAVDVLARMALIRRLFGESQDDGFELRGARIAIVHSDHHEMHELGFVLQSYLVGEHDAQVGRHFGGGAAPNEAVFIIEIVRELEAPAQVFGALSAVTGAEALHG